MDRSVAICVPGRRTDRFSLPEGEALTPALAESDAQLVARAQGGDEQSFAELVRRHSDRVFRLAVSILGKEFVPEAEDVAQEVFLKVHHAIGSFRGEAEFSTWIYRITFNLAVNWKARVRFRSPHTDESVLYEVVAVEPGPHAQAEAAQLDRALTDCIETLPEAYQAALRMYYWLEISIDEVAELLGVPGNTAKSYLHRSRQLLRGMLKERGYSRE
jgi:RNA polymerase sigma-70 factor, ECF subfamily